MDWFEQLTGFREGSYEETRANLEIDGEVLRSRANGRSYRIGKLHLPLLSDLQKQVQPAAPGARLLTASVIMADVRDELAAVGNAGALFQVASQFNLLEMVSPHVTPEDGVTRYIFDRTQGPACAIAAGPATIFRNYFAPVGGGVGQTQDRQLDALADLGHVLGEHLAAAPDELWEMRNGYALPHAEGLQRVESLLAAIEDRERDRLRGHLRIGVHQDIEIPQSHGSGHVVSQAFCSALPIAYSRIPRSGWERFARLVLEGAYEATLLAAVANMQRGASNRVFLTLLGGGAFGNDFDWIAAAIRRALALCSDYDLRVYLVSYDLPDRAILNLVDGYRPNQRPR